MCESACEVAPSFQLVYRTKENTGIRPRKFRNAIPLHREAVPDPRTGSGRAPRASESDCHCTAKRCKNLPDELPNRLAFRAQLDRPAVLGLVPGVQRNT